MANHGEIIRLRDFLQAAELGPEERCRLEELLAQAKRGDRVALTRVEQLAFERGYEPIQGKDVPLPPGPLLVCPLDPAHYRTFRREVGEELVCREHNVPLKLAEECE